MTTRCRTALALAALAGLAACSPTAPTPPPSNTNVTVIVNAGNGAPNTGGSPAPGSTTGQVVYGVKIGEFGERGPNAPANGPREVRVGNVADVTCSPTDADAAVIKAGNPSQLVYFKQLGGQGAGVFETGDNAYNGTIQCKTTGVVVLECSLRDRASGTVVTGGNAGTAEDSPWTANCVS